MVQAYEKNKRKVPLFMIEREPLTKAKRELEKYDC